MEYVNRNFILEENNSWSCNYCNYNYSDKDQANDHICDRLYQRELIFQLTGIESAIALCMSKYLDVPIKY